MHHFFSIPDLVELLCEEVGDHDDDLSQDLAALARTATVFHHPALDVMWRYQDGLMNVILCMPADLWESEESVKNQNNYALARPITSSDVERTLIYSRRVKSLSINSDHLTLNLFRILDVMKPFLPQGILFPNFRQLDLSLEHESGRAIIPYLSLALVTSICLHLEGWPNVSNLPLVYPALKRLQIDGSSPYPTHHDFLTGTSIWVRKLVQIEELTLPTLDRAAYDHLSTLPALSSLSLKENALHLLPSIPPPPAGCTGVGFSVLQHLSIESMTLGFVTEVVNGFSNTPLRSLYAESDASDSEPDIRHFFAALSTHIMHNALEKINLIFEASLDVDGRTLSHLLCFSHLREVTIHLRGKFLLDNAAVWDMARAWPNLVRLRLSDESVPPIMTLASLHAFATHCPELFSIGLTFDATILPPSDEQPLVQKKLLSLQVFYSPISSPALVGRFLAGIFPNIEQIQSFDSAWSWLWMEVEAVVKRGGI
ncbi:hypothetical protein C8J57DRAFT_1163716 [Mycena rebaudengoi]|nr:hypothetical protein C8J57DRAFT_1163716 [Mycena rebaudengoi]